LVSLRTVGKDTKLKANERRDASLGIRVVSAREEDKKWLIEHAGFLVYDPLAKKGEELEASPRGVILLMPGLLATPEGTLDGLARRLRRSNWVVLRMVAQPSRFIERFPMVIESEDVEGSVGRIARVLDERTADCAYVTAEAFAALEAKRPELAKLPRIAIGFSGGAITLPTVVALEADRYAGAVMVGGGSNFLQMIDNSNYTSFLGGEPPQWPEELKEAELAALKAKAYDSFAKQAVLDAFNTAGALRDKHTLMVYGSTDQAVPSPLSDQLWARMGKKQREVYDVGHEVLFAQLAARFDAIVTWCNAVGEGKDPATVDGAAGKSENADADQEK
jgi:predicted esterase